MNNKTKALVLNSSVFTRRKKDGKWKITFDDIEGYSAVQWIFVSCDKDKIHISKPSPHILKSPIGDGSLREFIIANKRGKYVGCWIMNSGYTYVFDANKNWDDMGNWKAIGSDMGLKQAVRLVYCQTANR